MEKCISCEHWRETAPKDWGVCMRCQPVKTELQRVNSRFTTGSCPLRTHKEFGCNQYKVKVYVGKSDIRTSD